MKTILMAAAVVLFSTLLYSYSSKKESPAKQVVVTTKEVTNVTGNSAVCEYSVTRTGGRIEHGVCVNREGSPAINSKTTTVYRGTESKTVAQVLPCSARIGNLKSQVKYFVRAYEKLGDGSVVYGNEKSFTTQ